MPGNDKKFNSILHVQVSSMIRHLILHNETFWLGNKEEKHFKATNFLVKTGFKTLFSLASDLLEIQPRSRNNRCLVPRFPRRWSPRQQQQWVSGCGDGVLDARVRQGSALGCCPGDTAPSTAPARPGEFHPAPFTGDTGGLHKCVTEAGRLVSHGQTRRGEPGAHFLLPVLIPSLRRWLRWVPERWRPFEPVTAVICSMKKLGWQQQGYRQSLELHRVSGIVKTRFLIHLHFVSSLGKYKTITCLNLVGMRLA